MGAEQAELAARNRWSALRSLQDVLVAGVRVDAAALKEARDQVVRNATQRIHELELQVAQRDLALRTSWCCPSAAGQVPTA